MSSSVSTGRFRRTHGQSPRVLKAASQATPYAAAERNAPALISVVLGMVGLCSWAGVAGIVSRADGSGIDVALTPLILVVGVLSASGGLAAGVVGLVYAARGYGRLNHALVGTAFGVALTALWILISTALSSA